MVGHMFELTEDARPAVDLPRLPQPHIETAQSLRRYRRITVRLGGRERHGLLLVAYDYGDRAAYRVSLREEHGQPREAGRWWWTDRSMRWGWLPYAPRDAEVAPPHHEGQGPDPAYFWYPPTARPEVWIVIGGRWTRCPVNGRETHPGGRTAYHVEVPVQDNGVRAWRRASYWWDPRFMRDAGGRT